MDKYMNKKGFTLVELLAVIVILGVVTGISIVAVFTSIRNAKMKSEKEFLTQLSNAVEAYTDLCISGMANDMERCNYTFGNLTKNVGSISKSHNTVTVYGDRFGKVNFFDNIVREGILAKNDFTNPINSKNCYDGTYIHFYVDEDAVHYYKIVLPGCLDYSSNIIHNMPNGFNNQTELNSGYIAPPNKDKETSDKETIGKETSDKETIGKDTVINKEKEKIQEKTSQEYIEEKESATVKK